MFVPAGWTYDNGQVSPQPWPQQAGFVAEVGYSSLLSDADKAAMDRQLSKQYHIPLSQ
jgi:hypothetical protein